MFLNFVDDHHADGRLAVWCKSTLEEQRRLVADDPEHFFVPPYVGVRGWVGMRLDRPGTDWIGLSSTDVKNLQGSLESDLNNEAAVRAYSKAGFRPVGVMRCSERDVGGGGWHDSLLMEFVAGEDAEGPSST